MKTRYQEIFKLKKMLKDAGIPFDFTDHSINIPKKLCHGYILDCHPNKKFESYQICYPVSGDERWISVVESFASYGSDDDKLEIMGGLTPLEESETCDSVMGWLTADDVFERIKNHYEKEKENERK